MFPGIPTKGTEEYLSFLASFWPSLYAGLIASLVTGVVVGLVILVIQRWAEARGTKRQIEREFASFLGALRSAFNDEHLVDITDPVAAIPSTASSISRLINEHPIEAWKVHLHRQSPVFKALEDFTTTFMELSRVANSFKSRLKVYVRHHNASQEIWSPNDPRDIMYFTGRVLGYHDQVILPLLDYNKPVTNTPERFEKSYKFLIEHQHLKPHVEQYLEQMELTRDKLENVRRLVSVKH